MTFIPILKRAQHRKGGASALSALLPYVADRDQLLAQGDDRYLSKMCRVINNAGFNWTVIKNKWPQFEEAFLGFNPHRLAMLSPDQWDAYLNDKRVVRHSQKIKAVYDNTVFVMETARLHGSFGAFLADWPSDDIVGLLRYLKKHGARLGGNTGQWFLRSAGKDCFVLTTDVVRGLQEAGLDIADNPSSQRDLMKIQQQFNSWHSETGLPYGHLSRILACATGSNRL
ncbi:MAG TPA: DNA-3-methyladenine glycosylase I [Pseudomonadales bacterium]|nr:DNA-3-methyladenine glycosylase I [Pseudomonadales bacterium]